jgi:3-deoxy-7-phosphoheptulonate synthase
VIIILQSGATEDQIQHVIEHVESLGLRAHLSRGTFRTIIGVIGDEQKIGADSLRAITGVQDVMPVLPPYKLASREAHPQPSVVEVAGVKIGGGNLAMIAGPCAVEDPERMHTIAGAVKASGANIFRGGAYKPRTSPYAFQGLGEEGLRILREAGDAHGLPVVTEVMDPRCVPAVEKWADMIQIGARNMQNFSLLKRVGQARKPVLLKRGLSATIEEWLMSAEYILAGGNNDVILCERGIRTFETATRNTFDISAIPVIKKLSHLPIVADPSHGAGRRDMVAQLARAAVAAGADGLIIEVHNDPDRAWSDGAQSMFPAQFDRLMAELRIIAPAIGRSICLEPVSKRGWAR